jgi:hypothetical protein
MADKILKCIQCGAEFIFTAGEQNFFAERDLVPPKRCQECRAKRKTTADQPSPREGTARRGSR